MCVPVHLHLVIVLCLYVCVCVHGEEGSEEKMKEKRTSSLKFCNHTIWDRKSTVVVHPCPFCIVVHRAFRKDKGALWYRKDKGALQYRKDKGTLRYRKDKGALQYRKDKGAIRYRKDKGALRYRKTTHLVWQILKYALISCRNYHFTHCPSTWTLPATTTQS